MDKKTKIVLVVKGAATIVAGVAVAAVATAALKNIVPTGELTKLNKGLFAVGTIIISSMVADAGASHVANIIDSFISDTSNALEELKEENNSSTIQPEVI